MFGYIIDSHARNRRHAIKPDEADYLTKLLPTLNTESNHESSLPKYNDREAPELRPSNAAENPRFSFSTWKNTSRNLQQPKLRFGGTASDDSCASLSQLQSGNKRKHSAILDGEDDTDAPPAAIDILHPSELWPQENGDDQGTRARDRDRPQVFVDH
ncbi:MAG: hypothetical protein LQ344_007692 [Seirophora lacunosa]|nr:MAG: hypothetical protein LQ344_007692 [Seirophora lacunosa]